MNITHCKQDFQDNFNYQQNFNKQTNQISENYDPTQTDSLEVKELKTKMKVIMNKLNTCKKEKEQFHKQNKLLSEEVMTLQSNLSKMISGFSNTSSAFPMLNELVIQVQDFFKYDCVDIFFDLLCPELNMKGILYFFQTAITKINEMIAHYFQPATNQIKKTGCFENIDGPIMSVLRKSYQLNFQSIIKKCLNKDQIALLTSEIQNNLKLGGMSSEATTTITIFLTKLSETLFYFYISDPPLQLDPKLIGTRVYFNSLKHDPFDGFIKNKEECLIILPFIYKQNQENDQVVKALVLQKNYEIPA